MEELKTLNTTILIIQKGNKILLGQKKRGFAKGVFIGIGGKQNPNETIDETMIRETQEEIGVTPTQFQRVGIIYFDTYYKGEHVNLVLNIYKANDFDGEPVESDEILPIWFDKDNIPYDNMLEDDIHWMEIVLSGKMVTGKVVFDENLKMQSNTIRACDNLEIESMQNEMMC